MVKHTIKTIIVDNSKGEKCNARCGIDWSSAEVLARAREEINNRFGDGVQLEYLDTAIATNGCPGPELEHAARNNTLPLLFINGELKIAGEFDIRLLLDAIDIEMEIKS